MTDAELKALDGLVEYVDGIERQVPREGAFVRSLHAHRARELTPLQAAWLMALADKYRPVPLFGGGRRGGYLDDDMAGEWGCPSMARSAIDDEMVHTMHEDSGW